MILDRQKEIVYRARHRLVLAMIALEATVEVTDHIRIDNLGLRVKDSKAQIKANEDGFIIHSAQILETDDECDTLIERSPSVMQEVLKSAWGRTQALYNDTTMHGDDKVPLFESEDLVLRATGLPAKISIEFSKTSEGFAKDIQRVPFPKLSAYFYTLNTKMAGIDGRIHSVDITHRSGISAHDYYKIATKRFSNGFGFFDGQRMLNNAYNLLGSLGMPLGIGPLKPN